MDHVQVGNIKKRVGDLGYTFPYHNDEGRFGHVVMV